MFERIMVPVDLKHEEQLDKTIYAISELARVYGSKVTFVGVSLSAPTEIARNPKQFSEKLAQFAEKQNRLYSMHSDSYTIISVDPTADLEKKLLEAIDHVKADLVVMATHIPDASDYIFANHGNFLATHAKVSVFLVRP